MAAYYLDTSALVKRYVREQGTLFIVRLTDSRRGHLCWTSNIACVEFVAALCRRVNAGTLTPAQLWFAEQEFRKDIAGLFQVVDVTPNIVAGAMALGRSHSLRAYDAVHLATALNYQVRRKARNLNPLTLLRPPTRPSIKPPSLKACSWTIRIAIRDFACTSCRSSTAQGVV